MEWTQQVIFSFLCFKFINNNPSFVLLFLTLCEHVVTMCHRFTPPEQLKTFCLSADIIITATGVPNLITADMVKEGACVIDVGITRVNDPETGKTKLVGDVDFDGMYQVSKSLKKNSIKKTKIEMNSINLQKYEKLLVI